MEIEYIIVNSILLLLLLLLFTFEKIQKQMQSQWSQFSPEEKVINFTLFDARGNQYCSFHSYSNRPFLSSKNSDFKNEAKCKTFPLKMSFFA